MEDHMHGEDGHVIVIEPDPVAEEAAAVEVQAEAAVEIAKVEAERDVELAKVQQQTAEVYANEDLARLSGEVSALREIVERLSPPEPEPDPAPAPEPEPVVVVDDPPAEPAPVDDAPPPPAETEPKPKAKKSSNPWW